MLTWFDCFSVMIQCISTCTSCELNNICVLTTAASRSKVEGLARKMYFGPTSTLAAVHSGMVVLLLFVYCLIFTFPLRFFI